MNPRDLWKRHVRYLCDAPSIGLTLDISRMSFDDAYFDSMAEPMTKAFGAMDALEQGAVANVDEDRRVGHYWLRAPDLAPDESVSKPIRKTIEQIRRFATDVHSGAIKPQRGDAFDIVLVIGVGGSALGPQLLADALGGPDDPMLIRFIDNTDPDAIARLLAELDEAIDRTLTIVISKSGTTRETRNAMIEVSTAFKQAGLEFAKHAVAITCENTPLAEMASRDGWLATLSIWDWVGGRTSVTSAVGLLPAVLVGIDIDDFLSGARDCDKVTRSHDVKKNPAALLALMWHYIGGGCGERNLVALPYSDRLERLSRYLQQLIMESIGKKCDRNGGVVHQGLTVLGNKGSSDQHSIMQQLFDGRNDFFVLFIRLLRHNEPVAIDVDGGVTTGDYLDAYWQGVRQALSDNGRESISITLRTLDARSLGAVVALFERAVGIYAELINVNAYDQPGVAAGKEAASVVLDLQRSTFAWLGEHAGTSHTADDVAGAMGCPDAVETIYQLLQRAAVDPHRPIVRVDAGAPDTTRFQHRAK